MIHDLRAASPIIRVLTLTQLAFNVAFYMVVPYLAIYLASDIGLGAAAIGVVLGVRTISQQGLFIVGGILSDTFGVKPVVLAGCVLRILGFIWLAVATSLPTVIAATILIGLAAALFSPAVESEVATRALIDEVGGGPPRAQTLALFAALGHLGAFAGPLFGSALLLIDFRVSCLVAAALFAVIAMTLLVVLPLRAPGHRDEPWSSGWRDVIDNPRFLAFAGLMSVQLIAYNQVYLLLPFEIERSWGSQQPLGWLLALSSVAVVIAQMPIARRLQGVAPSVSLPWGFGLMGLGFVAVAVAIPADLPRHWGLMPLVVFVLLLVIGEMIVIPCARDLVPRCFSGERHLGAHYGFMSSLGGVSVLAGSVALGAVHDVASTSGWPATLTWWTVAALCFAAGVGLRNLPTPLRR